MARTFPSPKCEPPQATTLRRLFCLIVRTQETPRAYHDCFTVRNCRT